VVPQVGGAWGTWLAPVREASFLPHSRPRSGELHSPALARRWIRAVRCSAGIASCRDIPVPGWSPDGNQGGCHATGAWLEDWRLIPYLLVRDPVFEEILLEEPTLALVTYLMGERAQLSSMTCHLKGPGERAQIALHTDTPMIDPLPPYSNVCNVNFALVDYTRAGGCLAVVPGSHRWARSPRPDESSLLPGRENPHAVPVEVPAGSAVVWHGNLWHGSYPRTTPGLRLNLATYFARPWMKLQERYGREVPAEILARHADDERFARLIGLHETMGWKEEGPSYLDPVNVIEGRTRRAAGGHRRP
jgi:hypothetical protein